MLNDATLRNFEDMFQLVQSKAKDTVQSAHCAMFPPVVYKFLPPLELRQENQCQGFARNQPNASFQISPIKGGTSSTFLAGESGV